MSKASQYLGQVRKLDLLVKNKMIERQMWRDIAVGISPNMSGDRVQSSSSQQKMADAVNRMVDLEREIDSAIDALVDKKREIIAVIEQLDATEYDVLHKIYVQGKDLQTVADDYAQSYSWASTTKGMAVKSVQRILDARENGDG